MARSLHVYQFGRCAIDKFDELVKVLPATIDPDVNTSSAIRTAGDVICPPVHRSRGSTCECIDYSMSYPSASPTEAVHPVYSLLQVQLVIGILPVKQHVSEMENPFPS
eukprot:COSAG02_NODE_3235_length_7127_cov_4.823847_9_plen_108_part_00